MINAVLYSDQVIPANERVDAHLVALMKIIACRDGDGIVIEGGMAECRERGNEPGFPNGFKAGGFSPDWTSATAWLQVRPAFLVPVRRSD